METTSSTRKSWRRPFVHILVLYAGDQRILRYAREVQSNLLDRTIDVLLQAELPGGGRILMPIFIPPFVSSC